VAEDFSQTFPLAVQELEWFFQSSKDILLVIDQKGLIQYVNSAWERVLGFSLGDIQGKHYQTLLHPADIESSKEIIEKDYSKEEYEPVENRYRCKDGSYRWLKWNSFRQAKDGFIYLMAYDINQEKLLRKQLIESYEYYRSFLQDTRDAVDVVDLEGRVLEVNRAFERIYGWSKAEVAGHPLSVIPDSHKKEFEQLKEKVLAGERVINFETIRRTKSGKHINVSLTVSPIYDRQGEISSISCTSRDITDLIESRRQLVDSKLELERATERLSDVLESMVDGFIIVGTDWKIIYINKEAKTLWNGQEKQLVGRSIWEVFPKTIIKQYEERFRYSLHTKTPVRFKVLNDLNGRYYEISTSPSSIGISVNIRDIHDQETYLAKLKKTEEHIRAITENINEVFCIIPKDQKTITYISPAYEKISGLPAKELYDNPKNYYESVYPEDQEKVRRYLQNFIEEPHELEYRIIHKERGIRWIRSRKTIVRNVQQNPEYYITVSEDITELKEKDMLIRKGDKLGVVGQLAAGIAHEIRNPLTAIKGFVQLWGQNTDGKYSEIILSELQRIESIMNEFLMLAKPHQEMSLEPRNLNGLLSEVIMLMNAEALLKNVEMVTDYTDDLHPVLCEVKQIKQVVVNLVKNAIEAMPNGGKLTVRTENLPNGFVSLQILDQGVGISKERIARLGEPFFSNKEKGTGLGLMVSFKIIENHKGTIEFKSEPDEGTTVEIRLPSYQNAGADS